MRFSNGSNIDKQGRICLGKFVKVFPNEYKKALAGKENA